MASRANGANAPSGAEAFLIQSTDSGKSWKKLDNEFLKPIKVSSKALPSSRRIPTRMFAAQRNGDLFGSEDGGASWFKIERQVAGAFRHESGTLNRRKFRVSGPSLGISSNLI